MAVKVRADLGKPVEPWYARLKPELKPIGLKLHQMILASVPGLTSELKWGMPWYLKDGMICGVMATKAYLSLFFPTGTKLREPKKLLKGSGKMMRALQFTSPKELSASVIQGFVKQAVALTASA